MAQLNYDSGQARLKFDAEVFDFRGMVTEHLSSVSMQENGPRIEVLEQLHTAPGIFNNQERYRQFCFSLFRTEEFQTLFREFGKHLIERYFDGSGLIQKTPTVRIQLPGALSTSFHSDGWYGHGATVKSFWLPLTSVGDGNTLYMAKNGAESRECLDRILAGKMTLGEINHEAMEICEPFTGAFGDLLSFSSEMIHGAKKNTWEQSRVSFDFRIAPLEDDIGTKPRSNYFSYEELVQGGAENTGARTSAVKNQRAITYSNLCGGKSAKAQLMLCVAYAEASGIDIIGNESEIVTLPYMPVIREYLSSSMSGVDLVVVFGVEIFQGDVDLAQEILTCADESGKTIVFCAEGIHYLPMSNQSNVLDGVGKYD